MFDREFPGRRGGIHREPCCNECGPYKDGEKRVRL